jgi:hypothetical protein
MAIMPDQIFNPGIRVDVTAGSRGCSAALFHCELANADQTRIKCSLLGDNCDVSNLNYTALSMTSSEFCKMQL